MVNEMVTRKELLHRWRVIEDRDADEDEDHDNENPASSSTENSKSLRFRQLKEKWFSDAFSFLFHLSKEIHIWCGNWDLMGPLLETFFNYFKDEHQNSPLKLLWKRISEELRHCTQCICQHHQAQENYNMEYETSSVGPLIFVLQSLDENRVTEHLKELNMKIAQGEYDSVRDNAEVVSVMFEVLMFPALLDDQSLVVELEIFIEVVDNSHELTLAGDQRYPGVYALLFFKSRRARSIGFRLAVQMGKLRVAADLEALQPLLKRYISFLEREVMPTATETNRPRVQLERVTVWHGIKSLLGFFEPPAFEEGILERYPIFLSIVLNHISDDSLEFSFAINCLRKLFEILGCKLWLSATLSPSVMHNTLLGQCFHTRNEKSHKDIFDLFQPFLQSLEALQDGEHEKQRRHCLYFLLHQVTVSSNFSILMRKKACQIALRIIHRGYRMNPPCPPFECAHMWGPTLVSHLKDSSLHGSLRQPAFDLIQNIIVSDAAALVSAMLNSHIPPITDRNVSSELNDGDDKQSHLFAHDVGNKDTSCWNEFSAQGNIAAMEYGCWMCIPMLWVDVLVEIDPSLLPVSFSKAVFWALSRVCMVEPLNNTEMLIPVRNWLTHASETSHLYGWKVPRGSDDGGDWKESSNSAKVSTMCIPLVRTFRRLTIHYIVRVEQSENWKQWTWEPRMGESLMLLLVDPDDNARQVARRILEHVSKTRTLASGLQFLCSRSSSLSAIFWGFRHALKLVQLNTVPLKFQKLHNFFFVLCKVLKEGNIHNEPLPGNSIHDAKILQFSSQGGFLQQPVFDSLPTDANGNLLNVDSTIWKKFCCLLSAVAWPSILKCLVEGKTFVNYKISQMTCIRLLETLPIVFERLLPSFSILSVKFGMVIEHGVGFKWLLDLMDWGKSSLAVIIRYWKQTIISLLDLLMWSCSDKSSSMILAINELITSDNVSMAELTEQVSCLCVSLVREGSSKFEQKDMGSHSSESLLRKKCTTQSVSTFEDADIVTLKSTLLVNEERDRILVLAEDDMVTETPTDKIDSGSNQSILDSGNYNDASGRAVQSILSKENLLCFDSSLNMSKTSQTDTSESIACFSQKLESETMNGIVGPSSLLKPKAEENKRIAAYSSSNVTDISLHKLKMKNETDESISSVTDSFPYKSVFKMNSLSDKKTISKIVDQKGIKKVSKADKIVNRVSIHDSDNHPLELALKTAGRQQGITSNLNVCGPKRQVIQLNLPAENRCRDVHRLDGQQNRCKPPKLDDWYKPILELDYFEIVGLAAKKEEEQKTTKLKEVPVCFQSPDEYVSIFRPLVLEEFKAQLQSSFMEMSSSDMCCGSLSVLSVERVDDFHIVRGVYDDTDSLGPKSCVENDLILLTRVQLQNGSHDVHMVGKVERREKDDKRNLSNLVIRFYLQNGFPRLNRARKLLLERSKWFVSRLMSITPQLREFQALSSIINVPLLPIILNPMNYSFGYSESSEKYFTQLSKPLQQILKLSYNDRQVQAISFGIGPLDLKMEFNLSLIQGPPGTGKTRTIVAIVSGLLALCRDNDNKRQNCSIKSNTSCNRVKLPMSQSAAIARAWQEAALAKQLYEDEGKNCKSVGSVRGRVLICAQSNAAVDELVSRISTGGLYGGDGVMYKPYLVRVGNTKTVHPNSLSFHIDTLVENRLAEERMNAKGYEKDMGGKSSTVLRSNLEKIVDRIRFYEAKRANLEDENTGSKDFLEGDGVKEMSDAEIGARLRTLYAKKRAVFTDLAAAQVREKKVNEESRALRHKLRKCILREAEIVVTTLSGCGGDLYAVCCETITSHRFGPSNEHTLFDAVVIDEAAQALEPATLIPLQLLKSKGSKCIMVGDPKQLPATVISSVASRYLYHCSMFERLQRAGHPVLMLTKQYRMHPEICRFPSLHFYNGKLLNGEDKSTIDVPFHETEVLGPYIFFDIVDGQELRSKNYGSLSFYNECEADAAIEILRFFRRRHPSEFSGRRIGIVTPYKSQLSLLRSRFSSAFGSSTTAAVEFNTVDGFQGREVEILVLSTVRAVEPCSKEPKSSSSIGFVADVRRMNVALTRAKLSLWILGNTRTLITNKNWEALVIDAKKRNLVRSIKKPYIFSNSNSNSSKLQKRECVGAKSFENIVHGDKDSFPSMSEADITSRRKYKTECILSVKKDLGLIVEGSSLSRNSKDVSTISAKRVEKIRGRMSGEKQFDVKNSSAVYGGGHDVPLNDNYQPEQMTGDNPKSFDFGKRQQEMNIKVTSGESVREREGNDKAQASNASENSKDAMKKRKQQRDAVDALLSSALIPSKKPGTSVKLVPAKRPISPTIAIFRSKKTPKPRKDNAG